MNECNEVKIKKLDTGEVKKFAKVFPDAKYGSDCEIYAGTVKTRKSFLNGYMGGIIINKKPSKEIYKKHSLNPEVAISFFYVWDGCRGQGLGNKLLQIPLSQYDKVCLITNKGESKPEAIHLYEKNGFKKIEEKGKRSYWYWEK